VESASRHYDELGSKNTGTPNVGGSIATAGGLLFIAATNDSRIRAFSSKTGEELWSARMEATGNATPITYEGRDGQQYVVVAAGGPGHLRNVANTSDSKADSLVAFSLSGREAAPNVTTSNARPASTTPVHAVLPDANGKQEVLRMCTPCHGTETFAASRMSRDQWKAEVDNMIARGARGSDAEVQAVIDYLAQNLGAPAPRGGKK